MQQIPILAIPNQTFSTTINDVRYDITLRSNGGFITYDLSIDEVVTIQGFRIMVGQLFLPYKYQQNGNFILNVTDGGEPDYNNFGGTQILYYLTDDEANEFKNGN